MPSIVMLEDKKTCETCRFVSYKRSAATGVSNIRCENDELAQRIHDEATYEMRPPSLTFSCNRWGMRKPELGFIPTHLRDES